MKNTKQIQTILYLGALWGIAEATIGHLLHFLPYGFSGMFMFPIGFYFMYNAYEQTDNHKAILLTGVIAASIKLFDFLLPMKSPMSVLNPSASIILESLVVFAFNKYVAKKKTLLYSLGLGFSWIIIFIVLQAMIFKPASGLYLYPISQIILFIELNTIVSGLLIAFYLHEENFLAWKPTLSKQTFVVPLVALQMAIILEMVNALII